MEKNNIVSFNIKDKIEKIRQKKHETTKEQALPRVYKKISLLKKNNIVNFNLKK
jgi:hypothetical protein